MNDYKSFELTPEHVILLRASYVCDQLSDAEYGAAEIDPKRPYGNGDVEEDIAELLGLDYELDEDGDLPGETSRWCRALHEQTPQALQVVLASGSFEPGEYRTSNWYGIDWRRV